jgi:hydroxymethylpyrimidine/phosphomethylpyrimidine kinase
MEKSNVKITAEELETVQPKERSLVLDPIVIATFGDLASQLRAYINCLCKATGCTFQSKPQSDLDG